MYRVNKYIDFCYGHRLLNYPGKCRRLHGHNGLVEIRCEGENLDERGMLTDFGEIKRLMKSWIDDNLDHRMILNANDPLLEWIEAQPDEPCYVIDENPTAEALARHIYLKAREFGLPVSSVILWETVSSFAEYTECGGRPLPVPNESR